MGAATDSDLSALLAGLVEGPEGAFAAVFSLLSRAGEFACPKETKMVAKNAIVPQVSLSVKVGMVVDAILVNAEGVKAGSRPASLCCFRLLIRRFSNRLRPSAQR